MIHGPYRVHLGQSIRYELEAIDTGGLPTVEITVHASHGYALSSDARQEDRRVLAAARFGLTPGTRFPIDVVIPNIPSHALQALAWASLWIEVRAFGNGGYAEQRFPLHACARLEGRELEPAVVRGEGPIELALGLGATRATGGGTLVGEVSLAGQPGDVRIDVDVTCTVRAITGHTRLLPIASTTVHVPAHAATGVPFTLELPAYLAPSLAIDTHQIEYAIHATYKRWLKSAVVSLPLHIVDASPAPAKVRPPHVAPHHIEPAFVEVATRAGWRIGPSVEPHPELGTISPWIYAAHAGLVMRLGYAFRGDSTFLISRIRYQPLELGLQIVPSRAGGGSLVNALPASDRGYTADARDHARATPLVTAIWPELAGLGALVRWDDDVLICELPVTEVDLALVDRLATALREVTRKLASALHADEREAGPYR